MGHIFISYSREDVATMRRIRDDLLAEGLDVWTDERLEAGTRSWQIAIERALENARCLVVIFSPAAKRSKWVREEMNYAEAQDIRIFPILARGDPRSAVPFGYITAQWVDIRRDPDYWPEMQKLIFTLRVHLGFETLERGEQTPPDTAQPPATDHRIFPANVAKAIMVLQDRSSKWWRRVDALTHLGDLHDPIALPVLRAYLDDKDIDVRRAAETAIAAITGEDFTEPSPAPEPPPPDTRTPTTRLDMPKLVVTGPDAGLRNRFIKSISEIDLVSIERNIGSGKDDQPGMVSMDFGRLTVADDLVVYLFGMPVSERFDFMWKILAHGMLGFVLVIDGTQPGTFLEARLTVQTFKAHADVPYVIAIANHKQPNAWQADAVRRAFGLDEDTKLLPCDTSRAADVRHVLLELIYIISDQTLS